METLRSNRIGIPSAFKDTQTFSRMPQKTLDWQMHESRSMSSVFWKDKKLVPLFSASAILIGFSCVPADMGPRQNGAMCEAIPTSSMHVEYTTHICGVDVANQLQALYSIHNQSHKWWHRIFFFLLDMIVINMFIIYVVAYKTSFAHPKKPVMYLWFRIELCRALLRKWEGWSAFTTCPPTQEISVCFPLQKKFRNPYSWCAMMEHYS